MQTRHVVTSFLTYDRKILLVRRSGEVGTYRGRWAGISGYLEGPPEEQAHREIQEETGLGPSDLRLLKTGQPVEAVDAREGIRWIVHPFLFEIAQPMKIRLDWENTEGRWISPPQIADYETVPKLKETLEKVWPQEIELHAKGSEGEDRQDSQ